MSRKISLPVAGVWAAVAVASFLVVSGCSNRETAFEPLRDAPGGPVVSGQVRDAGGAAMTDAVVTLEPIVGGLSARVRERIQAERPDRVASPEAAARGAVRSTVTDSRGRFAFAGVSPGAYLLTGSRRDHLAGIERVEVPKAVTAETTYVDIALTPTGSFYGSVTLENATNHQSTVVYVQGTSFVAVTNPSGVYTISGVPVGAWTVRATHPGYLDESTTGAIAFAGDSVALAAMMLRLDSNINPIASATAPAALFSEVPAAFTGTGADDDGTVVRYEWDFENDGVFDYTSPSTATTTHEYPSTGAYTAKLRVTDNLGAIGLDAVSVSVLPAIFVSSTTGSNANPGTKAQPVASIGQGLTLAVSQGVANVLVAAGTYPESPTFVNGKSVRGGYHATTWVTPSGTTTVQVGTTAATANSITSATTISRLRIVANSAPAGQSSIALSSSLSSSQLQFEDCTFQAGNAGPIVGGPAPGVPGVPGGNGNPGNNGNCDGPQGSGGGGGSSTACVGGIGGNGGAPGSNNGSFGTQGACTGGAPGPGGAFGDPGAAGTNGTAGGQGLDGTGGTPGSNAGTVVGGVWQPLASGAGVTGQHGRGGGGGGGGGAQDLVFSGDGGGNGGGGGGGGGGLGTGGGGGFGGNASFAVYLFDSSPVLLRGTYVSGSGGAGGAGASGGGGGNGGNGGNGASNCTGEVGRGGNGGAGGRGGHGGGGAGGPGGPSYAVWREGTSAPTITATVSATIGFGGSGGNGGPSGGALPPASNGTAGLSGVVH